MQLPGQTVALLGSGQFLYLSRVGLQLAMSGLKFGEERLAFCVGFFCPVGGTRIGGKKQVGGDVNHDHGQRIAPAKAVKKHACHRQGEDANPGKGGLLRKR